MSGLQPQIEILESRISHDANSANVEMRKGDERHQALLDKISMMTESITDTSQKLEKSNTFSSKLAFAVDEYERKSSNTLAATELRLRTEIVSDRDEVTKKIQAVQARITSETERTLTEISKRELETTVSSRHQFEDILERLENTKKSLFEELDRKCLRISENSKDESDALRQKFKNQIASLDSTVDKIQETQMNLSLSGNLAIILCHCYFPLQLSSLLMFLMPYFNIILL